MTDSQRELKELEKCLKVGEGEIGQRVHRTTLKQLLNDVRLGVVLEEGLKIVAVTFETRSQESEEGIINLDDDIPVRVPECLGTRGCSLTDA